MIGTLACKQMYSQNCSRKTQLLLQLILSLVGIVSFAVIYISRLTPEQKWVFCVLMAMVGFCIGSLFNFYMNHEIILLTERNGEDISMNLNIVHAAGMLWTGVSQVIIGSLSSRSTSSIFLVYLAFAVISMCGIFWRMALQYKLDQR